MPLQGAKLLWNMIGSTGISHISPFACLRMVSTLEYLVCTEKLIAMLVAFCCPFPFALPTKQLVVGLVRLILDVVRDSLIPSVCLVVIMYMVLA